MGTEKTFPLTTVNDDDETSETQRIHSRDNSSKWKNSDMIFLFYFHCHNFLLFFVLFVAFSTLTSHLARNPFVVLNLVMSKFYYSSFDVTKITSISIRLHQSSFFNFFLFSFRKSNRNIDINESFRFVWHVTKTQQ